jgi:hypothetical protein
MAQDDPRASRGRSAVATPNGGVAGRPRGAPWSRQGQGGQAWSGLLFDAAQLARGAVVFVGLTGCLVFVLLALMGGP